MGAPLVLGFQPQTKMMACQGWEHVASAFLAKHLLFLSHNWINRNLNSVRHKQKLVALELWSPPIQRPGAGVAEAKKPHSPPAILTLAIPLNLLSVNICCCLWGLEVFAKGCLEDTLTDKPTVDQINEITMKLGAEEVEFDSGFVGVGVLHILANFFENSAKDLKSVQASVAIGHCTYLCTAFNTFIEAITRKVAM